MTRKPQDSPDARVLRSVDSNLETTLIDNSSNKDLFDFDPYLAEKIPHNMPILVSSLPNCPELYDQHLHKNLDLVLEELPAVQETIIRDKTGANGLDLELAPLERRSRRKKTEIQRRKTPKEPRLDPLDDHLFAAYLNRMEREEKKMTNLDKSFMMSEYDKFTEQLRVLNVDRYRGIMAKMLLAEDHGALDECYHLLHQFLTNPFDDISRKLLRITKINDVRDYREVRLKYKLTIKELLDFTGKYVKLKKQEVELKNGGKAACSELSDEEDDAELSAAELRQKRAQRRAQEVGPVVKLVLDECVLSIDPINGGKFVAI